MGGGGFSIIPFSVTTCLVLYFTLTIFRPSTINRRITHMYDMYKWRTILYFSGFCLCFRNSHASIES